MLCFLVLVNGKFFFLFACGEFGRGVFTSAWTGPTLNGSPLLVVGPNIFVLTTPISLFNVDNDV